MEKRENGCPLAKCVPLLRASGRKAGKFRAEAFMTLDVKSETAAALESLASAEGLSVEDYLEQLVEKQLPFKGDDGPARILQGSDLLSPNS